MNALLKLKEKLNNSKNIYSSYKPVFFYKNIKIILII